MSGTDRKETHMPAKQTDKIITFTPIEIDKMELGEIADFEEETGKTWSDLYNGKAGMAGLMGLICLQERRAGRQVRDGQDGKGHAIYRDMTMGDLKHLTFDDIEIADPPTVEADPPAKKGRAKTSASEKSGTETTSEPSASSTTSAPETTG